MLLIGIFLLNINIVNSTINESIDENYFTTESKSSIDIGITEVSDGLGLDLRIENNGDIDIDYLILENKQIEVVALSRKAGQARYERLKCVCCALYSLKDAKQALVDCDVAI